MINPFFGLNIKINVCEGAKEKYHKKRYSDPYWEILNRFHNGYMGRRELEKRELDKRILDSN